MKQYILEWGTTDCSGYTQTFQHLKIIFIVKRGQRYWMEWLVSPLPHFPVLSHCTKQNRNVPWSQVKEDEVTKTRSKIKEERMCTWGVLVHTKASSYMAVQIHEIKESMMLLAPTTKKHLSNFEDFFELAAKPLATWKQSHWAQLPMIIWECYKMDFLVADFILPAYLCLNSRLVSVTFDERK